MTVNKEIGITIDWESIVMDVLKLERFGYTNITMQMQEKEDSYISLKNTDSMTQLCEIANKKIVNKSNNEKEFLNWIADRLVHVYEENENIDFIIRLRKIANEANNK